MTVRASEAEQASEAAAEKEVASFHASEEAQLSLTEFQNTNGSVTLQFTVRVATAADELKMAHTAAAVARTSLESFEEDQVPTDCLPDCLTDSLPH